MADTDGKVGQMAGKLGFVPTSGSVSLPKDDIFENIFTILDKIRETPEYKELIKKRRAGAITKEEAFKAVIEIAKQFDKD